MSDTPNALQAAIRPASALLICASSCIKFGMAKVRPDYVKMLKIVAKGNLRGLLDEVTAAGGLGLPAAIAAMAPDDKPGS
jgi:hypothetical protein